MKSTRNLEKSIVVLFLSIGLCISVDAQTVSIDSTKNQLDRMFMSTKAADHAELNKKLHQLAASKEESNVLLASQYFYRLKNVKASDSVNTLAMTRFPLGLAARTKEQSVVFDEKGAANMEAAYKKWVAKFPSEKFGPDHLAYDYARSAIASNYAKEKNTVKAIAYINLLEVDFWKGNGYGGLGSIFYKNGDLVNAEIYIRKAMESAGSYTDGKKGNDNAAKFAASGYPGLCSTYANILYDQKKYAEALKYIQLAYKSKPELSYGDNLRYARILIALNRNQEAFDKLELVVKAGKATPEIMEVFKTQYIKVKGSDAGYAEYTAAAQKANTENLKNKLTKEMLKETAAQFVLSDLDGHKVSLEELKGKIVILDFWATWCAPCKASFPAMQMALNKYAADPNVKFLFIHTWESSATATKDAKDFIEKMKYPFQVLMDLKDQETRQNKVVTSYNVHGIPAKFVIDPKGDIRFKLTGFDGSNEAAVEEISMMIDMIKSGS